MNLYKEIKNNLRSYGFKIPENWLKERSHFVFNYKPGRSIDYYSAVLLHLYNLRS
jgi:hypothetical protein